MKDTEHQGSDGRPGEAGASGTAGWARVARDLLAFQFKLVVDGLKDLCLAQVALGAAIVDLYRRDGTPGRRFYGIVRLSERFDGWLGLHEPLERMPPDAPEFAPPPRRSVDDIIEQVERSARTVARSSREVSARGLGGLRRGMRRRRSAGRGAAGGEEIPGRA